MQPSARKAIAVVIVLAEVATIGLGATSSVSAQDSTRSQIRRQQQLILRQQREIESNQRRIEGQREHLVRSPVTGEAIDERKLPKGLLSGFLHSCPMVFAYKLFVGCVLYVAH